MNLRPILFGVITLLASLEILAVDYKSHIISDNQVTIVTDSGDLQLTALAENVFDVHYKMNGIKQLPSYAISKDAPGAEMTLIESDQELRLINGDLVAVVNKASLNIQYFRNDTLILEEESGYFGHQALVGFRFKLQDNEKLIGGGERVLGMDRRGHRMPLYNRAHYGYTTESNQMNYSMPAVLSSNKYLLLFDNTAKGAMDLGHTQADVMQFEAIGGRTAYIVTTGDTYPKIIESYTEVTGRQPLPARWTLGNFASRFGYHSEAEARDVVAKFQAANIPLDAIIFDLFWFGKDIQGHMGNLVWDPETFPTPETMISDFAKDGVNTIVITEPFILTSSKQWQSAVDANALATNLAGEPRIFDFYFGETGLVDVFDENAKAWFWQYYAALHQQGIAGWWGDLGEPEVHPHDILHSVGTADEIHNVYGHVWAQMVYENHRKIAPNERPFILMRSGFAGSQRYGLIPWTGDVSRSWGGLKPQVELSLQMGLLGMAYTHSDLGGFAGDNWDKEMYIRWLQYGVFQPIYRPHAQEEVAPEPVFHDEQVQQIIGDYIRLRYQLMPYNYTLAYQNATSGMPLMRPLFFTDESNMELIDNKDAYLWGDAFLVSPVTDAGTSEQEVFVPKGVWFDYWRETRYEGGTLHKLPVDLNTIPVLVKAGAFVPMVDTFMSTKAYSSESLTVHYYHDDSVTHATGEMFEDDGKTFGSIEEQAYELLEFSAAVKDTAQFTFNRAGFDYEGKPETRSITLVLHNWNRTVVTFDTQVLTLVSSMDKLAGLNQGIFYDADSKLTYVKFEWKKASHSLNFK